MLFCSISSRGLEKFLFYDPFNYWFITGVNIPSHPFYVSSMIMFFLLNKMQLLLCMERVEYALVVVSDGEAGSSDIIY